MSTPYTRRTPQANVRYDRLWPSALQRAEEVRPCRRPVWREQHHIRTAAVQQRHRQDLDGDQAWWSAGTPDYV